MNIDCIKLLLNRCCVNITNELARPVILVPFDSELMADGRAWIKSERAVGIHMTTAWILISLTISG